jgi:hypothetical protein
VREEPSAQAALVKRVTAGQADGDGIGHEGVQANRAIPLVRVSGARQVAQNARGHAASHVVLVQALQLLSNARQGGVSGYNHAHQLTFLSYTLHA